MILQNLNTQKLIFLADDDEDDRIMFAEALSEVDSSTILTQAEDGKELLEMLYSDYNELPQIVFLDINMPKIGGFECLEKIKQNSKLKELFVIMLSTSADPVTIDRTLEMGASFYAVKPNSFDGLKNLIKQVLQIDWTTKSENKFRLV